MKYAFEISYEIEITCMLVNQIFWKQTYLYTVCLVNYTCTPQSRSWVNLDRSIAHTD